MPDDIRQKVDGSENAFSGSGDVLYKPTYNIFSPDTAPPDSPPPSPPQKLQISRLPRTDSKLFGREEELHRLNDAWQDERTNVLVLIAMGGTGKTALMQTWLDQLEVEQYQGATAVYTWSFYSQGSAEDKQASADDFFNAALPWFGYDGDPIPSAHDKGLKLAQLINQHPTLLLLDGLEPLQYPPGGAMDGALRDDGLKTLFLQLAADNRGLLLISSRQPVRELDSKSPVLVEQRPLSPLSPAAGIALFRDAGIAGTDKELADTVEAYHGHALSLNLLANYLSKYAKKDIRRQDTLSALTDFPEETRATSHAFKVMAAYERQLRDRPELRILFLMGLFDRPVSSGAMDDLRQAGIAHLSEPPMDERVFHAACERLRKQGLLNKENTEHPDTLDTHPLVRQYFGERLRGQHPDSWRQAHARFYAYYKAVPDKERPDTLEEMEPLFAAVRHGCAAGLHQQALDEVYYPRIQRDGQTNYLCKKLGAFGADLSVLSHFFAVPWQTPAPGLTDADKAVVLNWAAFRLRALGRMQEAAQPMQAGLDMQAKQEDWKNAASAANSLSELHLTIGAVSPALEAAEQAVRLADTSKDAFYRMMCRTTLADALHQAGEPEPARAAFVEAEQLQREDQPEYALLYSLQGFRYCDLLLTGGAWQEVRERAGQTLEWAEDQGTLLLDRALDKLSLGRAALQEAIEQSKLPAGVATPGLAPDLACILRLGKATKANSNDEAMHRAEDWLDQAVDGLRKTELGAALLSQF
jgi:tetratricopeptide (TPR) repeat protein